MSDQTTNQTTTPAPRALPGKMTTRIGSWNEDKSVFTVRATLVGATPKDLKAVIRTLGYGAYDIVTGRDDRVEYRKVERDTFG